MNVAPRRPLKVYAFDPSLGRRYGNFLTVRVPGESALAPGPRGALVEVIDYDISNRCYYRPVDLNAPEILLDGGLEPSEASPHFHQQMVYAVASGTIEHFSFALGRPFRWSRRLVAKRGDGREVRSAGKRRGTGKDVRLRILPHAFQEANAYYDPDLHALHFGYFAASRTDAGDNLPGQTIFTCLSHDIVAHETTHALLHHTRPHFLEPSGQDAAAFHEAFADVVALLQHFSIRDAVLEHLRRTGGVLYRQELSPVVAPGGASALIVAEEAGKNVLIGLAQQFGEGMGMRQALRSSLGSPRDPAELDRRTEPHQRGAILLAAIFDAFFSAYANRMAEFLAIAGAGNHTALSADLVNRLATEAAKTADHFLNMCIRALDYCPPVDITFGDYLRALITADKDLVPEDAHGYRELFIEAFRARGIRPGEVSSYSEASLVWARPDHEVSCPGLRFDLVNGTPPEEQVSNARLLHDFAVTHRRACRLDRDSKVQVWGFHPVYRVGPDGQLRFEAVVQLLQHEDRPLAPKSSGSATFRMRGGTTLILDLKTGVVRYVIYRRLASRFREECERDFRLHTSTGLVETYAEDPPRARIDLARLHRGY